MASRTTTRVKKQAREEARLLVDIDEAGFGRLPALGKTWRWRGSTPLLEHGDRHQPLAVISAVTETGGFYYAIPESSFTGENVATFLRQQRKHLTHSWLLGIMLRFTARRRLKVF